MPGSGRTPGKASRHARSRSGLPAEESPIITGWIARWVACRPALRPQHPTRQGFALGRSPHPPQGCRTGWRSADVRAAPTPAPRGLRLPPPPGAAAAPTLLQPAPAAPPPPASSESNVVDKLLNKRYAALYPTVFMTYRRDTGAWRRPLPAPHLCSRGWAAALP